VKNNGSISNLANTENGGRAALFGSPEAAAQPGENRRERIRKNSLLRSSTGSLSTDNVGSIKENNGASSMQVANDFSQKDKEHPRPHGTTMETMTDVLRAVHAHVDDIPSRNSTAGSVPGDVSSMILKTDILNGADAVFMSLKPNSTMGVGMASGRTHTNEKKPPFALRVLVQERMAKIVAADIAGYQSHVEIKENTLSVTIDNLKVTADKWMIPRRARKAFRAVAFEALYFVGEHGLITRGADALFDLTPFEFHGLFGPLLAAMGDADTMDSWLARTHVLADTDLKTPYSSGTGSDIEDDEELECNPHMEKVAKEHDRQRRKSDAYFPSSYTRRNVPGNAFTNNEKKTLRSSSSSIYE